MSVCVCILCVWHQRCGRMIRCFHLNVFEQGFGHVYLVQKKNGQDKNEVYALKEVVVDISDSEESIQKCEEKVRNERKVIVAIDIRNFAWDSVEIIVYLFVWRFSPIVGAGDGARLPLLHSNAVRFQNRTQILFGTG